MDIRTNIINDVIMSMQTTLTEDQLNALKQSLYMKLNEYDCLLYTSPSPRD